MSFMIAPVDSEVDSPEQQLVLVTINENESPHSMYRNRHKFTVIPPWRGLIRNPAHPCPLLEIHDAYYRFIVCLNQLVIL